MKLDISWKTAFKVGFFFQMGVAVYKSTARVTEGALDSAMINLAKKEYEPAVRYCKRFQLKVSENEHVHTPRKVVGFKCYSEES